MNWWLWILVGFTFLGLELLTPGGFYVLFFGAGALLVGLVLGAGLASSVRVWLVRWPIASAVLDGQAVAADGSEGIQAVFEARNRPGSPVAFTAFDLLELDGQSVMGEA